MYIMNKNSSENDNFKKNINYVNNTENTIDNLVKGVKELSIRESYYNFINLESEKDEEKKVKQSKWWFQ